MGEIFPGQQSAILDRKLFDAVQAKLDQQRTNNTKARQHSDSVLMGRIFDGSGKRMTPTYAVKRDVRYRYYISATLMQGERDKATKFNRVPAVEIERLVISAVRKHFVATRYGEMAGGKSTSPSDKELISAHIARVDVKQDHLAVQLAVNSEQQNEDSDQGGSDDFGKRVHPKAQILVVPCTKTPSKRPREIILPASESPRQDPRPIRAETRAKLVSAIATARQWLDELICGTVEDVEQVANREKCSVRQVNRTITLAFLAPRLVKAAVDGRLPRGIGVAALRELPAEWVLQHKKLGLSA